MRESWTAQHRDRKIPPEVEKNGPPHPLVLSPPAVKHTLVDPRPLTPLRAPHKTQYNRREDRSCGSLSVAHPLIQRITRRTKSGEEIGGGEGGRGERGHGRIIKDRLHPDTVKRRCPPPVTLSFSPCYNRCYREKRGTKREKREREREKGIQHRRKDAPAVVARQPRLVATYGGAGAAVARKSRPPRRRLIPNNSHTLERVLSLPRYLSRGRFYRETLRPSKCSYFAAHRRMALTGWLGWLAGSLGSTRCSVQMLQITETKQSSFHKVCLALPRAESDALFQD